MQRGTDKVQLSVQQQYKHLSTKAVKTKNK